MRKVLLLFAVALSPFVAGSTTFGPEVPIAPAQYALAVGEQVAASLACNDQSCLALWSELDPSHAGLYSSVIDADGKVHPAASTLLRPGFQGSSSLVWTGDHYLAVWNDAVTRTLVAASLTREGLLTGAVQSLTTFPANVSPNALVWNGRHVLVVFNTSGGLDGAVLDANGNLIRSFVVPSSQQAGGYAVAAAAQVFGVAWTTAAPGSAPAMSSVFMERFDDGGAPLDANAIPLASNLTFRDPRVGLASDGSRFGVAFVTSESGSVQRLRVDAGTGAIETLPLTSFNSQLLGVYWSGDDFVAYAPDVNNIDTQQFTGDAVRVLDVSTKFLLAPQIVQGPSGAVAIWIDSRPSGDDKHIFGALLDRDSTVIRQRDLIVAHSAVPQTRPALALSPAGALLVWQMESNDERAALVATRLDRAGNPIDATPIPLGTVASFATRSVLWLGDSYLVVFPYGDSIAGKRISASGAVLDSDPIIFGKGSYAALAFNGTTTVLAVSDADSAVRVIRLSAAATVIDTQTIASNSRISTSLAAAANGSEFVVAWTEQNGDAETSNDDIYAVRLTASGQPMDASPIVIANSAHDETAPTAASDGRDFVVAYRDGTNVALKRLLREGTVINGVSFASSGAPDPQIAFAGGRYLLTWGDLIASPHVSVARTATVDATGAVIDPPSTFAQGDSPFAVQTALVPGLVAYSRGSAAGDGIPRVFARLIASGQGRTRAVRH
jgi:hypothetical protein